MSASAVTADAEARRRIREELDATLFVEAQDAVCGELDYEKLKDWALRQS